MMQPNKESTSQPYEKVTSSLSCQPKGHQFQPVSKVQGSRNNITTAVNSVTFLMVSEKKDQKKNSKNNLELQPCAELRTSRELHTATWVYSKHRTIFPDCWTAYSTADSNSTVST